VNSSILEEESTFTRNCKIKILKNEIHVEGKKFKLTKAYLKLLKRVYNYIHLIEHFESEAKEKTLAKLFSLFNVYNSKSTQLIIGRGGLHFEVLKKITSRNLAMSTLCLEFSFSVFSYLEKKLHYIFSSSTTQQNYISKEIQKLAKDYHNHLEELFSSIINILADRLTKSVTALQGLHWNQNQQKFVTPTKPSAEILQDIRNLYLAIEDYYQEA
jgi:vacuolar protein sorting-associated protein 54